jgi:hypothetical protein
LSRTVSTFAATIVIRLDPVVTVPNDAYIYARVPDFMIGVPLLSIRRLADNKMLLVNDNSWRTARTFYYQNADPVYETWLHFFDGAGPLTDLRYEFLFSGDLPPSNLHALNVTLDSLELRWNHTNPAVVAYKIQMRPFDEPNSTFVTLEEYWPSTSYDVSNLNQSTSYEFLVFAYFGNETEWQGVQLIAETLAPTTEAVRNQKKKKFNNVITNSFGFPPAYRDFDDQCSVQRRADNCLAEQSS